MSKKIGWCDIYIMVIYKITNKHNRKIYIGQTTRPIDVRLNEHFKKADKNSSMMICRAMYKYGKDNFEIEEIDR